MNDKLRFHLLISPNHKNYKELSRIYLRLKNSKEKGGITSYLINAILAYENLQKHSVQLSDADIAKISDSIVSKLSLNEKLPSFSSFSPVVKTEVPPVQLTNSNPVTSVLPTISIPNLNSSEIPKMDDDALDMLKIFDN